MVFSTRGLTRNNNHGITVNSNKSYSMIRPIQLVISKLFLVKTVFSTIIFNWPPDVAREINSNQGLKILHSAIE